VLTDSNGAVLPCHYDDYGSFAVMAAGHKDFWLCSPKHLDVKPATNANINERHDVDPLFCEDGVWYHLKLRPVLGRRPSGQKARGKRPYIDESADAETDHGCEEEDNGLAGSRFVRKHRTLTASERASHSAAKYLAVIRTARMTVKAKIDLMEIMLVSESDGALKSVIEECLEDDISLRELARVLEEPGSGE
jgi:hypothetical protein